MLYLLLILFSSVLMAQDGPVQHWTTQDTLSMKRIGEVLPSKNGNFIAYRLLRIVEEQKGAKWQSQIILQEGQKAPRVFTPKNVKPILFRLSHEEDSIIFLAKGTKYISLWIQNLTSNEPVKLLEMKGDISSFKWSPDDTKVAFVFTPAIEFEAPLHLQEMDVNKEIPVSRLYVMGVSKLSQKATSSEVLTSEKYSITPWGISTLDTGFDWSPDGSKIAFCYQNKPGLEESLHCKIALLDLKTKSIKELTSPLFQYASQPQFSPDGKYLAFCTNVGAEPLYYQCRVCIFNIDSFDTHFLYNTFNEDPGLIGWNATSSAVFVWDTFKIEGLQIYEIPLDPFQPVKLAFKTNGWINPSSITLNDTHQFIGFSYEKPTAPQEAYVYDISKGQLKQKTFVQNLPKVPIGNLQHVSWESFDKRRIDGLLITPPEHRQGQKHPLVVAIHGGPTDAWSKRFVGSGWFYNEYSIPLAWGDLVGQGYVVFLPNYRGSSGYGQEFRLLNQQDLGGGDFKDIMTGVDALIDTGLVNEQKMFLFGWSYGGYLSAWAVTQTDRFKGAVIGAPFVNLISFYGTTDIPQYVTYYLGGTYWQNKSLYLENSPLMFVQNVKTPVLLFHGTKDARCPLSQSYEFYQALKAQKKPVRMYYLSDTGHTITDANLFKDCLLEIIHFFENSAK